MRQSTTCTTVLADYHVTRHYSIRQIHGIYWATLLTSLRSFKKIKRNWLSIEIKPSQKIVKRKMTDVILLRGCDYKTRPGRNVPP